MLSISELVKVNENGLLFTDGSQLAEHLLVSFDDFFLLFCVFSFKIIFFGLYLMLVKSLLSNLGSDSRLAEFRQNLQTVSNWNGEWDTIIKPILLEMFI